MFVRKKTNRSGTISVVVVSKVHGKFTEVKKFVAWSIWLICIGLLLFIARDNAVLRKQQNINRYVHAYFSDNAEVMMELDGIDLMFSDQVVMPMPIKNYRECMKERKKDVKDKYNKRK